MRTLIFTEGGNEYGYGHIARCISLYEELTDRGIETILFIKGNVKHAKLLDGINYKTEDWQSNYYLEKILKNDDFCIIDSYLATEDIYYQITQKTKNCLYIDDTNRIKYPNGIVVRPSLSTRHTALLSDKSSRNLSGPMYIILRKVFKIKKKTNINTNVKEVLIILGGSDIRNLTPTLLKILKEYDPNLKINIVTGEINSKLKELKRINLKGVSFYQNVDSEKLAELMLKSDMAITAAGQTLFELIATRTPFIPIKVVDNQEGNINSLKEYNIIDDAIDYNHDEFEEIIISNYEKLLSKKVRYCLYEKFEGLIDGLGSKRVIDALLLKDSIEEQYFIRHVHDDDILKVFQLSNQDYVRRYSLNKEKIEWTTHKEWFNDILKSENHVFHVIIDKENRFLGQIKYQIKNSNAVISISLDKALTGQGLSKMFLMKSLELFTDEKENVENIIAYISTQNAASKRLFEKAGFTLNSAEEDLMKYNFLINRST